MKPSTWVLRELGDDYGVDAQVEIFDGDSATGLVFNLQLKSSSSHARPSVRLKKTTLNYWRSLDTPTLVVLVDSEDVVRFEWAHMLDLYGRPEAAVTHTFDLLSVWTNQSWVEIESEVRAARATKHLRQNLPIAWHLSFTDIDSSTWRAESVVKLETALRSIPELVRQGGGPYETQLDVVVSRRMIGVRLRGRAGGFLHYSQDLTELPTSRIVADATSAIAYELGQRGLDLVALRLLRPSVLEGTFIGVAPDLTAYATECLCRAGDISGIMEMLEKVYFNTSLPFRELVLITIVREKGRLAGRHIVQIAERLAREAASKAGEEGSGELLYNAANLLSNEEPEQALVLYGKAAVEAPKYLTRGYWWRERGAIQFEAGKYAAAIESYSEAFALGESSALPLLADSLCHAGRYAEAVSKWRLIANVDRLSWLIKPLALEGLVEVLGLEQQDREPERAQAMFDARAHPDQVLAVDAMNSWALWQTAADNRQSQPLLAMRFQLAAACFARTVPVLWFEAFMDASQPSSVDKFGAELRTLVLAAAVQESGSAFRHFIIQDAFVPDSMREKLLNIIDLVPPLVDEPEIRLESEAR